MREIYVANKKEFLAAVEAVSMAEEIKIICHTTEFNFDPIESRKLAMIRAQEKWTADYKKSLRATLGRIKRMKKSVFESPKFGGK